MHQTRESDALFFTIIVGDRYSQGVTKKRDVVYFLADQQRPRILARLRGEGSCGVSAMSTAVHRSPNNGDLTSYLTYGYSLKL
jgi:hypothetical protein